MENKGIAGAEEPLPQRASGLGALGFAWRSIPRNGIFQAAGVIACIAIFVAHLQDGSTAEPDPTRLTISNQALLVRLFAKVVTDPSVFAGIPFLVFVYLVFAAALLAITSSRRISGRAKALLVTAQLMIGLLVNNDLLLILAAELPIIYRTRSALYWLLLQSLGIVTTWMFVLFSPNVSNGPDLQSVSNAGQQVMPAGLAGMIATSLLLFGAWQLFAFGLGYIAMSERRNRDRLTAVNAQLLAAQQLLAESARSGERLRIARDLHDGMGHHLTALRLHLDLAARQASGAPEGSLVTARNIADDLLNEVRTAVGRERSEESIDLEKSLRTMCAGIPGLIVTLEFGPHCAFTDPRQAHAIFRGIQEAVSNVMRHADAERVWVKLRRSEPGTQVDIQDNGSGASQFRVGNGLRGMRERIEACGGRMTVQPDPGSGFHVAFWLPHTQGAQ